MILLLLIHFILYQSSFIFNYDLWRQQLKVWPDALFISLVKVIHQVNIFEITSQE